jgi:hypothetical protein
MNKFTVMILVLVAVFGGGALGLMRYMSGEGQGRTTEIAANAIVDAANAAARWTEDRTEHSVSVVNVMGQARGQGGLTGPVVVHTMIVTRGGSRLSNLCASLPRVRDAINVLLADRVGQALRTGATLGPKDLAPYKERLRAVLNRTADEESVESVTFALRSAYDVRESGCNESTKSPQHAEATKPSHGDSKH